MPKLDVIKRQFQEIRETYLSSNEQCLGQFKATAQPPFALRLLVGAFAGFLIRPYIITVTNQKVYFSKLNIWENKLEITDSFGYDEIEKATVKTGKLLASLKFRFKNGGKLKLRATYRQQKPDNLLGAIVLDEAITNSLKDQLPCIPY